MSTGDLSSGPSTVSAVSDRDGLAVLDIETYRLLFQHMLNGMAYCRMIFEEGNPADFIYLATNPAFPGAFQYRNLLTQDYPNRSYCLRYRETDLAFIERLLAEEGISYHYSHGPEAETSLQRGSESGSRNRRSTGTSTANGSDASDGGEADAVPQHTLILFDRNDDLPGCRSESDDDEEYVHKVAFYVDKLMRNLAAKDKRLSTTLAAVLTAINIADERFKLLDENQKLKDALSEAQSANEKNEAVAKKIKSENDFLKREVERLKIELARAQTKLERG